ncbi:alpha/beta-hydrolase [Lentinus tigrinus ALCF2SS1-7]|uniref:Alpha/beta-hydrolase n=1 Tax=Lentinus tigrinus ALCF2SS1-6 TaxID=1328759 RepID=A0A5C2RWM8_9APHY|nr:alpha/beta-hydrolase [Lentinus tigrinus ALCF2SS1-6]RPD69909.1 alpha/beta-hydrolase [Lentinus tigrinus ALCF2SS1-7]
MTQMQSTTSTFTASPSPRFEGTGLNLVAKRYVAEDHNPDGVTLIFFHCTGSHKEVFEPIIPDLLALKHPVEGKPIVREAWLLDNPAHGDASVYNDEALKRQEAGFTVEEWCECFKILYASGAFEGHTLIPIGHSVGATAIILATMPSALPPISFKSLILVEPSLITRAAWDEHLEQQEFALKTVSTMITKRRDTWKSRADARAYFEARIPWGSWDPRILDLFVQHALREVTVEENGQPVKKVTLCCTRLQEYTQYTNTEPHFVAADRVGTLDRSVAVHVILGEREDVVPEYCHDSVLELRPVASLQKVPDAGHFVVQENPDGLGVAIARILTGEAAPRAAL